MCSDKARTAEGDLRMMREGTQGLWLGNVGVLCISTTCMIVIPLRSVSTGLPAGCTIKVAGDPVEAPNSKYPTETPLDDSHSPQPHSPQPMHARE